jgi:hypothetical protein
VTYAALTANRDEKELRQFEVELHAGDPSTASIGAEDLMAVMTQFARSGR